MIFPWMESPRIALAGKLAAEELATLRSEFAEFPQVDRWVVAAVRGAGGGRV